tara:strand:- start:34107 stop:34445 length:339 start_codon:yes stop_codon:yes gene_type:complete
MINFCAQCFGIELKHYEELSQISDHLIALRKLVTVLFVMQYFILIPYYSIDVFFANGLVTNTGERASFIMAWGASLVFWGLINFLGLVGLGICCLIGGTIMEIYKWFYPKRG